MTSSSKKIESEKLTKSFKRLSEVLEEYGGELVIQLVERITIIKNNKFL